MLKNQGLDFKQNTLKKSLTILLFLAAFVSNAQSVSISSSASGSICAGTSVTFTATPSGISSPTYQWYKNGTAVSGETNLTYTTASLSNNDQVYVTATPAYTAGSISSTGLIANFDAANYNPTSSRWTDLSASGNHMDFYTSNTYATLKTATTSSDGGGSLIVNNNSVYGKTINNTGITGNGGKTMSAWVKFDAADRDWTSIASIGTYDYPKLFELFGSRNGSGYQIYLHWSGGLLAGTTTIPINTWANITIKADGSSLKIFVNGNVDVTGTQTLNTTNSPLYMGAPKSYSNGGWNDNLRGRISTLSLYNIAVSDQTILDNYNATKGRYTATAISSSAITSSITAGPSTPILTVSGDACINKTTLSTPSGLSSYTWTKDNVTIPGATSNTYSPSLAGAYKVAVSNGTCSSTSSASTISTCGVTADGKMSPASSVSTLVSNEGGINFGTGTSETGSMFNTTGITTTTGTIGSTTAVLGGVISATNALTSSIGVIYSTDSNFGTYSTSTIQSNVGAGTYNATISGLSSSTPYFVKSFIVNKSGTIYGEAMSFTTTTPPITLGSLYRGGFVFYIFQSGEAGYVSGETHGLIAETRDQTTDSPTNPNFDNTNWCTWNNALSLIADPNNHSTAGKLYTDWRFPTKEELLILYTRVFGYDYPAISTYKSTFNSNYYWSSTSNPNNSSQAWVVGSGTSYPDGDKATAKLPIRSIRSF